MTQTGYDNDFYAWLLTQATHLRAKQWDALDIDNLAEELETLGRSERHAVASHLHQLLLHLLKWSRQVEYRSRSWQASIHNSRDALADRLEESPSIRPQLPEMLVRQYPRARRQAASETGLPEASFPPTCPWSLDQLQDPDFLAEE